MIKAANVFDDNESVMEMSMPENGIRYS